jgi:hypothetical protein
MKKIDTRKLQPKVQQELRFKATRLFQKQWKKIDISDALEVTPETISR